MLLVSVNHYLQQAQAVATGWPAGPLLGPSVRCPVFTYPHHAMLTSHSDLTLYTPPLILRGGDQGGRGQRQCKISFLDVYLFLLLQI